MALLNIACFGSLRITAPKARQSNLPYRPATALLVYLAVEPKVVHDREELAAFFWPTKDEEAAKQNLREALSKIRTFIGDDDRMSVLISDRLTVQFNRQADVWCDVVEFERLLAEQRGLLKQQGQPSEGRLLLAHRVVELHQGEFLANFSLAKCPKFEDWRAERRERYRKLALWAHSQIAYDAEGRGDYELARHAATSQLDLEQSYEEAHLRLMRIYVALGERMQAARQFKRYCEIMRSDLDMDPSEEAVSFYKEAIQRAHATRRSVPPSVAQVAPSMPPPALQGLDSRGQLFGRAGLAAALAAALRKDDCRALVLGGPPGVGKTHLALHVAELMRGEFRDGVVFVSLEMAQRPEQVLAEIARRANLPAPPNVAQLSSALRGRHMLLLLDTFEHVAAAAPLLADLLGDLPQIKALVTSRLVPLLSGALKYEVQPLESPPDRVLTLATAREYPAMALLLDRALTVNPHIALHEPDLQAAAAICRRLDGLPLALELAALQCGGCSFPELDDRLKWQTDLLWSEGAVPARHRSLHQAVEWSYQLLSDRERLLFVRLAVFVGTWTVEAATHICDIHGDLKDSIEVLLLGLLRHGLLQRYRQAQQAESEMRLSMLSSVHEYARGHLKHYDSVRLRERHARYYLALERHAGTRAAGADPRSPDYPNIVLASRWQQEVAFADHITKLLPSQGDHLIA